jgi:hypothetical protein
MLQHASSVPAQPLRINNWILRNTERFALITGSCETPSGICEHASAAIPFLAQRDSRSTLVPSTCSRVSYIRVRVKGQLDRGEQGFWEALGVTVEVRSCLRKIVLRIDVSTDSSTSRIGGEATKLHLVYLELDA